MIEATTNSLGCINEIVLTTPLVDTVLTTSSTCYEIAFRHMPLFPPFPLACTPPGSGRTRTRNVKRKTYKSMPRVKKTASSYQSDKPTSEQLEKINISDPTRGACDIDNSGQDDKVEEAHQVAGICQCLSLRGVFRTTRRYRHRHRQYTLSKSLSTTSVTAPTIENSCFNNPRPKIQLHKIPPKISGVNDEISFESAEYKSSASKSSQITPTSNNSLADIPKIQLDKRPFKRSGITGEIFFKSTEYKSNTLKSSQITPTSDSSFADTPKKQLDKRPLYGEISCESDDYKSSASKSNRTTYITDVSFFDALTISDGSSCGRVDISSVLDLTPSVNNISSIKFAESASKLDTNVSLEELFTREKASKIDHRTVIDSYDAQRAGRRGSGCLSLDEAETALVERQLDEMSNQSSILSFDAEDFSEDENDDGNYVIHVAPVETGFDLTPIDEGIGEDSEWT